MDVWGLIWFIALILALAGVMVLLNRLDRRAKNKSRENAYRLLDMENPPANELKRPSGTCICTGAASRKTRSSSSSGAG